MRVKIVTLSENSGEAEETVGVLIVILGEFSVRREEVLGNAGHDDARRTTYGISVGKFPCMAENTSLSLGMEL